MKHFILILYFVQSTFSQIVLPPIKNTNQQYALIWLQGAQVNSQAYVQTLEQIQRQFPFSLWIGIPQFFGNIPQPLRVKQDIKEVIKTMYKQGMSQNIQFFVGGHSLGSVIIQSYIHEQADFQILGVILHGGYISRKNRELLPNGQFKIKAAYPTLSLGGELDGLTRITRLAESYYCQHLHQDSDSRGNYPVVILKGVSHNQFASGDPPIFVKQRDLQPEVTYDQAHRAIGKVSSDFMISVINGEEMIQDEYTSRIMKPLIEAFILEGNGRLKPACDGIEGQQCFYNSSWSEHAQEIMGNVQNIQVQSILTDNIASKTSVLTHSCQEGDDGFCNVKVDLYVENVYSSDNFDLASTQIFSKYQKAKLLSRQRIYKNDGREEEAQDFNYTDGEDICSKINQQAIQWALKTLPKETLERYEKYGRKLVVGKDNVQPIGPLWLQGNVNMKKQGDNELIIRSSSLKSKDDVLIQKFAGAHYCMILTPGSLAEWMYVDGLREKYNIKK